MTEKNLMDLTVSSFELREHRKPTSSELKQLRKNVKDVYQKGEAAACMINYSSSSYSSY